jgi:nucleoid-associated protein YgaU
MILTTSRYAAMPIVSIPTTPDGHSTIAVFGPPRMAPMNFTYYRIKDGDRLDSLAQRFYGQSDAWWVIADANPEVFDPANLQTGTIIRIP